MNWVAHLENPAQVLIEAAWLNTDEQIEVSTMLCCQRKFFSASYFETIKEIMQKSYTCKLLFNTLENCFDFVLSQKKPDLGITEDIMLDYAGLENGYGFNNIKT